MPHTTLRTKATIALATAILVACGGGGGAAGPGGTVQLVSASSPDTATVEGGTDVTVNGAGTTQRYAMDTMAWQIQAVSAGAPAVVLTNSDCAIATKSDQTGTNSGGQAFTNSNWSCSTTVKAPRVGTDAQYQLLLQTKDKNGGTDTHVTTLTVKGTPMGGTPLVVDVGSAQAAAVGDRVQLNCLASGGQLAAGSKYSYQWVQTGGANAAVTLSDTRAAAPSFNAPAVAATTPVALQCRVTDDAGTTATATKTVSISPTTGTVLVASAGSSSTVVPGANVNLDGSKTGWFLFGQSVTGPQLFYHWTQVSGPSVTISNANSQTAYFTAPADLTDATSYSFRLDVADAPFGLAPTRTATAEVKVSADPAGALNLTVPLPSQSVSKSTAVFLQAKASSNAAYYSWTQVSGPTVALGGALTSTAGFVAPKVTEATTFVFRVTAGFKPIVGGYAGVASVDAVVVVNP
ncbi:MAG: hypothetical protein EKK53_23550 [Burkholderiales bacterium]|nr:MAG: hypothetical protein EKK53_23550 [Burkholderiales bacterium]